MKSSEIKFRFTTEYQWDLLRYTVQDKNGERALKKYDDYYFTLIEHQIIAYTLKKYYKKYSIIPGETIFREELLSVVNSRKFHNLLTKDDINNVVKLVSQLYNKPVKDGDIIYNYCKDFRSHVKLKQVLEEIDINDFTKYKQFANRVQEAINDEDEIEDMKSSFLLKDIRDRQFNRQLKPPVSPTPFKQINALTNAGGYENGSIMVILDRPKRGKTAMLANIARGYLRMRKKILLIDLENGKQNIFFRLEQSIMGLTKKELVSGEFDNKVQKRFRKYARLGGEVVVERLPALTTTTNDLQAILNRYYREFGIKFEILIIDYAAKMGATRHIENDTARISQVYLELSNLAKKNDIEHIWTANHVKRESAGVRMKTRYLGEDIAQCIDIVRHASAIFGLNRAPEEEEAGFFRLEIVDQRDGLPTGRAVFKMDMATQKAVELTITERKEYDQEFFEQVIEKDISKKSVNKKKVKDDFND